MCACVCNICIPLLSLTLQLQIADLRPHRPASWLFFPLSPEALRYRHILSPSLHSFCAASRPTVFLVNAPCLCPDVPLTELPLRPARPQQGLGAIITLEEVRRTCPHVLSSGCCSRRVKPGSWPTCRESSDSPGLYVQRPLSLCCKQLQH